MQSLLAAIDRGALPAMVCRPPTINGKVVKVRNAAAVKAMSGVTHVVVIPTGVAVRAATFGQCIDAVRALDVKWGPGTADGKSDADVHANARRAPDHAQGNDPFPALIESGNEIAQILIE